MHDLRCQLQSIAPACTRQLPTNGTVGHGERSCVAWRESPGVLSCLDVQLELVLITSVMGKNQCCTNKV